MSLSPCPTTIRRWIRTLVPAACLLALAGTAAAQQFEDTTYVPRVARPAFTARHPIVMIDQAHHNHFSMASFYRTFAHLLEEDGLRVIPGAQAFSPLLLKVCDVLVVADASSTVDLLGTTARDPAFRPSECDAVRDWVDQGGSLLLIADHAPFASAMDSLAVRFGVDQGKGYAVDTRRVDPETGNVGCILFTRAQHMIGEHAITRGRDKSERIDRVATFSGQSLLGPPGSEGFLVLSPSSADIPFTSDSRRVADREAYRKADTTSVVKTPGAIPAVGRFQGVAFARGKGRVVVLGEAAIFGSQFVVGIDARRMGRDTLRIGINRTDLDNQQLALNIIHWLTRVLN